ncbi:MAG: hypothetical protein ACYCOR_20760 [Acidobacteriaceae bacterium]
MVIIVVGGLEDKDYLENPLRILELVTACPLCIEHGVEHRLAKNGGYGRYIPVGHTQVWGWIYRLYCTPGRTAFSIHPEFMLERQQYSRDLVCAGLCHWVQGGSARSQEFLTANNIPCPTPEERVCWSDQLDCERTVPGYQLLWRWFTIFNHRAAGLLPVLVTACHLLGCDFRLAGSAVSKLARRSNPLCWAIALLALAQGSSPEDDEAWRDVLYSLVGYLGRPSSFFTPIATGLRAPLRATLRSP